MPRFKRYIRYRCIPNIEEISKKIREIDDKSAIRKVATAFNLNTHNWRDLTLKLGD